MFEIFRSVWKMIPFSIRTRPILIYTLSKLINLRKTLNAGKSFNKSLELTGAEVAKLKNSISFISWPTYDWSLPLKQRPHHIAEELAMIDGVQYIFCTKNYYDSLFGVRRLNKSLFLVSDFWKYSKLCTYVHVYATDSTLTLRTFKKIERLNKPIVYEILDEFHDELQGKASKNVISRHKYALESNKVKRVIVTARNIESKLPESVRLKTSYIPNACDPKHFLIQKIPIEKIVIGYFGALASWVDYDLISFLAKRNPDWSIKLIGMDYDGSIWMSGILNLENVSYLGIVDYQNLPSEIQFSVAIIPFKVNAITIATSPIKVFEYLASGFPVISTPLPELQALPQVSIGIGHEDFEEKIKRAITTDNIQKRAERRSFAIEQSWNARATTYALAIIDLEEKTWQK